MTGKWVDRVQRLRKSPILILDIDSSESPVHGDLERCSLLPGNVHSADNWQAVLDPVVKRYRWSGLWRKYLRGDAAFTIPELFDYLEANDFGYAIILKANRVLGRRIGYLPTRRRGRPMPFSLYEGTHPGDISLTPETLVVPPGYLGHSNCGRRTKCLVAKETRRSDWNWRPEEPVELSPLFSWPPHPMKYARWIATSWHLIGIRVGVLCLSIVTWLYFQSALERCVTFEFGWIAQMYGRNLAMMLLLAGGLHLYFYTWRKQLDERKFDHRGMASDNGTFTLRDQVWDNMFWTLASGVTIWTGLEVIGMWGFANSYFPYLHWADNPVWFVALFFLQPIWGSFHFYMIHRALHWPPLYKLAHSVHHRNMSIGPWSGMSMHPIEHLMYLSSGAIHWIVLSHPVHFLFHMQMKALEAITSHTGYETLLVKDEGRLPLGDFFHQLHHRYFECNYGTLEMPWDRWFGTFHNGDEAETNKFRERRRRMHFGN